jgi:EamA domain-containing membrane protein RarD
LLAGARGFYLSLLERVFHVKILCLRTVISFRSSLLPIAFITNTKQLWDRKTKQLACIFGI